MSRLKTTILLIAATLVLAACVSQPRSGPPPRRTAVDLDAVLPPQSLLREDTVTALTHDRSQSRLGYVGVWATDGDKCAMMDQTPFDGFAVITPDSIRMSSAACTIEPGQPGATSVRFDATCKAKGRKTTQRAISVQMLNSRNLYLTAAPGEPAVSMVRCRLQQ